MATVVDLLRANTQTTIHEGRVVELAQGATVRVEIDGMPRSVDCQVLQNATVGLTLADGDRVLVWLRDVNLPTGIVLGRIGVYAPAGEPVVAAAAFAARPETLILESRGDIVLRNGQAKIKLGAEGDVEIVGKSFVSRSRNVLRLLAPLIKLN